MPGNHIPEGVYSEEALEIFRLSSKSHWDVPINVEGKILHVLVSHPTPQGFDGEEDKNGRRNWDEVRLWADYLDGADWIVDDQGQAGGLSEDAAFVIAGDLNTGEGISNQTRLEGKFSYELLTEHSRVNDPREVLKSEGARHRFGSGDPEHVTFAWWGGSRIDYLMPSHDLMALLALVEVICGAVCRPGSSQMGTPLAVHWASPSASKCWA